MPGITLVAVGGAAKVIWSVADTVGVIDAGGRPFDESRDALVIAHLLVALVNALLVVVLWWVLRMWSNGRVAIVAAAIVATEPFLALHGARFTTDSFVMLFGAIGTFALAAAFGIPKTITDPGRRRLVAIVAGVGLAGASMTSSRSSRTSRSLSAWSAPPTHTVGSHT